MSVAEPPKEHRLGILLGADTVERIKALGKADGRSLGREASWIIETYLAKEESKVFATKPFTIRQHTGSEEESE